MILTYVGINLCLFWIGYVAGQLSQNKKQRIIMNEKYIKKEVVCEMFSIKPSTLYEWIRKGRFPRGIRFSGKCTRWSTLQIEEWKNQTLKTLSACS